MSDDAPAVSPVSTALQRASDGRSAPGSVFDIATWEHEYGPEGAAGLWPAAVLILAFVAQWFFGETGAWALSAGALGEGRTYTLATYMFVHAGLAHLWMNLGGLMALTPAVLIHLGGHWRGWGRYSLLFLISGLFGAVLFMALNPTGTVPMVGASGAICGLWGAFARIGPDGGVVPIRSAQVWDQVKAFAKMNVILFGILFILVRMSGGVGGLAWETHLGGFLFGLFAVPWLAPRRPAASFALED